MENLIGKRVTTFDGHSGIVTKHFKPTGRNMTVHIKQDDGRTWYCPDNDIAKIETETIRNDVIDLFIQLGFETGRAYQRIYDQLGLDNVIDFNDISFANSRGAQWNLKGDMSNLPELFKIHNIKADRIKALNNLAKQLQDIKNMANEREQYKTKVMGVWNNVSITNKKEMV